MVTGFEIWGHDANLRKHWGLRLLAFFYDIGITIVPSALVLYYLGIDDLRFYGLYSCFVLFLASFVTEAMSGASPGKWLFGFKVHPVKPGLFPFKVFIRNITRLFWFVLPPLDWALGMATRGDPRQRMLDCASGTKVVHMDEKEKHQKHLDALADQQKAEITEPEPREDKESNNDACRECDGKLIILPDEKLQCEACGLIQ